MEDDTVPKGSVCPTFAAATLYIKNPRWEGVPFILKAGKGEQYTPIIDKSGSNRFKRVFHIALNEAKVEVRIQYKDVTQGIFHDIPRNELVFRIQPNEAIYVKINAKSPGFATRAVPIEMDLTYKRRFAELAIPEAYESLILDALKGDHSNFVRDDELDGAWKVCLLYFSACWLFWSVRPEADLRLADRLCLGFTDRASFFAWNVNRSSLRSCTG